MNYLKQRLILGAVSAGMLLLVLSVFTKFFASEERKTVSRSEENVIPAKLRARMELDGVFDSVPRGRYNWAPYRLQVIKAVEVTLSKQRILVPNPFFFSITIAPSGQVVSATYLEKSKSMERINAALRAIKTLKFPALPEHCTAPKQFKIDLRTEGGYGFR